MNMIVTPAVPPVIIIIGGQAYAFNSEADAHVFLAARQTNADQGESSV
jgi:hypothetical protein